jgi:excisionase family DNA binding protein
MERDRLLSPAQVAKRLAVSVATVYEMCRRAEFVSLRVGRGNGRSGIRIKESSVNLYIERQVSRFLFEEGIGIDDEKSV